MGKLVLVVDDQQVNRLLAARMLKKLGWEAMEAEDGNKALAIMQSQPFDLVLLDISMPGLSGEEVCAQIRQGRDIPKIIAYTAHAMPDDVNKFKASGFDAVLIKPISNASLEAAIKESGL